MAPDRFYVLPIRPLVEIAAECRFAALKVFFLGNMCLHLIQFSGRHGFPVLRYGGLIPNNHDHQGEQK